MTGGDMSHYITSISMYIECMSVSDVQLKISQRRHSLMRKKPS